MDALSPDAEIIEWCKRARPDHLLSNPISGNKVLRLNESLVVKFGVLLSEDETRSQMKAYEILDPAIVRVPRVHRYFQDSESLGYIIMDYMEGEQKDAVNTTDQVRDMSRILQHLASHKSQKPGPLGGGPSSCLLFRASDDATFASVEDLEAWFNMRLFDRAGQVSFQQMELVLCHLDLFPRNILWLDGQPPCVLDWATAGFYPRLFERCSQLCTQRPELNEVVLDQPVSKSEALQVELVLQASWHEVKYCL
ncbi:hypothetical protein H2204_011655 [Knufia peltigerae]|uniref:Aminoglycoside phosphotransferase domain-containing protein n=1 Tax=Knufia peltigerae TaxID=1002370 RepID=A0AA38XTY2_9EURO|nr:hypothetical protein H2204_011655 [Knufia peltigerae]